DTDSDDEYRVWVNGWLVAKRWSAPFDETPIGSQFLLPGVRYAVRVELGAVGDAGKARLTWTHGTTTELIPQERLYPMVQGEGAGPEVTILANPGDVADATVGGEALPD